MKKTYPPGIRFIRCTVCGVVALLGVSALATPGNEGAWRGKISPFVTAQLSGGGEVEAMVRMTTRADLKGAAGIRSRSARIAEVVRRLRGAALSQQPVLDLLERAGVKHRAFWVVNAIWLRADAELLERLARRADVAHIHANPRVPADLPLAARSAGAPAGVEPNLVVIGAPDVWAQGIDGQGVVVGGQDTGYDWDHPALMQQYRGWDGGTANHDYNWHDAIHTNDSDCPPDGPQPCDDNGHGTHTMGTMVGDDGGGNRIGVAPGARWIGCRNMNEGVGTPASYTECFEWFMAPTEIGGTNPDPSRAPHVINNSWGCPPSEGCTDPEILRQVVENVRAAGIAVVVSAGNAGSSCASVDDPPAIYDAAFSVGATDNNDNVAGFSSRGPVTVDGSDRLKPEISAPGVSVRSSVPGGNYTFLSGTSMAGPHVAGLFALLMDRNPLWKGDVGGLEALATATALPLTHPGEDCGGVPGTSIPNNTTGWGRIDAPAAIDIAGEVFFDDSFE